MGRTMGGDWREKAMAKVSQRFSALDVKRLNEPGYHADGAGLYLRIMPVDERDNHEANKPNPKGWIFRFRHGGRTRDMGLGAYPDISLADARELAGNARVLLKDGIDPIEHRKVKRAAKQVAAAKSLTFDECAREFIKDHEAGWRNAKHRAQWTNTLKTYASPIFGKLPVSAIDGGLVVRALKEIWYTKPETASRVRGRVESVLDWARAHGYSSGENPARWKGNLQAILPAKTKVRRVKHHAALPFTDIGEFMEALRSIEGVAARALKFAILTGARSGEVRGATFAEIASDVWTVPAERMKAGREHRVPLSSRALAIVAEMKEHAEKVTRDIDRCYIFPGLRKGHPLSDMAMTQVLRRMGRDVTVHGFRSTFRDWAAERTSYPNHVVEMALAHVIGDKVEAAYRRGHLFEKRVRLMAEWDRCCAECVGVQKKVLQLKSRGYASTQVTARPHVGADPCLERGSA